MQSLVHWQLPTYDGTKSYQNLLIGVYGETWNSNWQNWDDSHKDTVLQQEPTNLIRGGRYYSGNIATRNNEGYFWTYQSILAADSGSLRFHSTALYPSNANAKGHGFSLRCLVR